MSKNIAFTITFEADGFEDKDEAVYAVLNAIQIYEEQVDPSRPIRWIGDDEIFD